MVNFVNSDRNLWIHSLCHGVVTGSEGSDGPDFDFGSIPCCHCDLEQMASLSLLFLMYEEWAVISLSVAL